VKRLSEVISCIEDARVFGFGTVSGTARGVQVEKVVSRNKLAFADVTAHLKSGDKRGQKLLIVVVSIPDVREGSASLKKRSLPRAGNSYSSSSSSSSSSGGGGGGGSGSGGGRKAPDAGADSNDENDEGASKEERAEDDRVMLGTSKKTRKDDKEVRKGRVRGY
jgi:hypothetical protein